MTQSYCYYFSGIVTIYFFLLFHTLASPTLHFCRHDQRGALLEFRDELCIYPRSWNKSSDCCYWGGVTCDDKYGQVISLDLSYSFYNNSLKSNSSLFRLQYLRHLDLKGCKLQGDIPSSIGNLSHLTFLDLSDNHLVGEIPTSIGNLKELRVLSLHKNSLSGNIPISLANLTKLSHLRLNSNNFTSTLPSDMSGFHNLEYFDVSENSLVGPLPKSLFSLPSLQLVNMEINQFTGPIEFANTSSSSQLYFLNLAINRFNGPIPESISKFLNLTQLFLCNNNFSGSIPGSLSKLVNLIDLHLSYNKLKGQIPSFLWRLTTLTLSHNTFSSFENPSQETLIQMLDMSSNTFQGPFPGWICKHKGLLYLDLSNNLFNGSIPLCLRNSIVSFTDLILHNNSFSGTLPDIFVKATKLRSFDVGRNQLEGNLPKSLINCKSLELVNVENNKMKDKFPSWLGSLPSLHVLILRSNEFHGSLYHPHVSIGFQSLRVIDVSHNDFTGTLPHHYFSNWREMNTLTEEFEDYMINLVNDSKDYYFQIYFSVEMVNKGVETRFERIRQDFRAIDFSGNRISGSIPTSIACLKELRLLNLSGNAFTSNIPGSLANLTKLETLDVSCNNLSGQIPQDLGKLSFLSYMNFSHNLLQGPVPQGTQFQIQKCSSFLDNPGLYGLEEICGEPHVPSPKSHQPEELSETEEKMINWVAAAIAYGPGVFCGLVIGHIFFTSHIQEREKLGRRKIRVTPFAR